MWENIENMEHFYIFQIKVSDAYQLSPINIDGENVEIVANAATPDSDKISI